MSAVRVLCDSGKVGVVSVETMSDRELLMCLFRAAADLKETYSTGGKLNPDIKLPTSTARFDTKNTDT